MVIILKASIAKGIYNKCFARTRVISGLITSVYQNLLWTYTTLFTVSNSLQIFALWKKENEHLQNIYNDRMRHQFHWRMIHHFKQTFSSLAIELFSHDCHLCEVHNGAIKSYRINGKSFLIFLGTKLRVTSLLQLF